MIEGLHSVVVFCSDTSRSREWFESLGFEYARGREGMHWFRLGEAELMLHPGGTAAAPGAPQLHLRVGDLDSLFHTAEESGLQPFDHQSPGAAMSGPVRRPWGDLEFELRDPDGQVWVFTQPGGSGD